MVVFYGGLSGRNNFTTLSMPQVAALQAGEKLLLGACLGLGPPAQAITLRAISPKKGGTKPRSHSCDMLNHRNAAKRKTRLM